MMNSKANSVACLSFNQTTVLITKVDLSSGVADDLALSLDFKVLDDAGMISQPRRLAERLQVFFEQHNLPAKIRIALNLQFLELRYLAFPPIPPAELDQIIRDEAVRESIYSYSGEPIAVAYKPTGSNRSETGVINQEFLVATTPQTVIASIRETFKLSGLKLLSIQPNLEGLATFCQPKFKPEHPAILLNVLPEQAEFYIWLDRQPKFWRHLTVGANQPEQLATEVQRSLEHFQRRNGDAANLKPTKIYIMGQTGHLNLTAPLDPEYLDAPSRADLRGIAAAEGAEVQFNFVTLPEAAEASNWTVLGKCWPLVMLGLLGLNAWSGWRIYSRHTQTQARRHSLSQLQSQQATLENRWQALQSTMPTPDPNVYSVDFSTLMAELRRLVPADLRFEKINFDVQASQLMLEGFCLEPQSLQLFLQTVKQLPFFKTFNVIDTQQAYRSRLTVAVFRLEIALGASQ